MTVEQPDPSSVEVTRKARLLYRLLLASVILVVVGSVPGLVDPRNDLRTTLVFYAVLLGWLGATAAVVRRGRVELGAWIFSLFYWLVVAFVTLAFGGLQGQSASLFAVCTLVVGGVVGARAAIWMAVASSAWCAFVMVLETRGSLPWSFGTYTPLNAWVAVTITVSFTSVLLHESLESLRLTHADAAKSANERDQALRRSIQSQKMELVGNLTSGIAHDLNNLLTAIVGSVELLRMQTRPEDQDTLGLLTDLQNATSRSALMTRQLLSFGRTPVTAAESVDLSGVVDATGQMLGRLLGSLVTVRVHTDRGSWISASRSGLEQILLNLAVNARDAMPRGGTFELTVRARENDVVLEAKDTGVGMTPEVQSRIFEPFFSTKTTGTGLGLATLRQVTEHYGGRIEVESAVDRGTTFRLHFPRTAPPSSPQSLRGVEIPAAPEPERRPRPRRILLVEDDPAIRRSLTRMLLIDGCDVTAVADGEEALALLPSASDLTCIVTDLSMPRVDGEQLADRARETRPELPMVIISGNRQPPAEILAGLPRTFLEKPFSHAELRAAIERVTLARGTDGGAGGVDFPMASLPEHPV